MGVMNSIWYLDRIYWPESKSAKQQVNSSSRTILAGGVRRGAKLIKNSPKEEVKESVWFVLGRQIHFNERPGGEKRGMRGKARSEK